MAEVKISICLDGPREVTGYLPAGWQEWDWLERQNFVDDLKRGLINDTVDFYVTAPWEVE